VADSRAEWAVTLTLTLVTVGQSGLPSLLLQLRLGFGCRTSPCSRSHSPRVKHRLRVKERAGSPEVEVWGRRGGPGGA
jgi:hypothetical protein